MATLNTVQDAKNIISGLHSSLVEALNQAANRLSPGDDSDPQATAKAASLLIMEVSKVIAASADDGRTADARTFEAMFDVNAASSHFQAAMEEGIRHAAQEIEKDGYAKPSATVLAASRALDAVADLLR